MELYELHVLDGALGTVDHGYAVAGRDERVGRCAVDGTYAAGGHDCDAGEEGIDLSGLFVEDVGTVAGDVGSAACDNHAEVVLSDNLDCEAVVVDIDILVGADAGHEALLYLSTGVVGVVKDAEFGVAALAVEVEGAVLLLVEIDTPVNQLTDLLRSVADNLLDGGGIREPVAGNHGVVNMLVEVVDFEVCNRCHSTLSEVCISLFES